MKNDRAFLSLLICPEDLAESDLVDALMASTGVDVATLRYRTRAVPPCILMSTARDLADAGAGALQQIGCEAFCCTDDDLLALGPTLKVRDMRLSADGVVFDLWRGGTHVIQPEQIDIVVRAKMSDQHKTERGAGAAISIGAIRTAGFGAAAFVGAWGLGGAYGMSAGLYGVRSFFNDTWPEIEFRLRAVLDIHTADGRVFQIDGDKFGFEILGSERGFADSVNIDRMCELFSKLSPQAAIDPYFQYFRPPPEHARLRIPNRSINNDHPAFAFYSRWVALMYRYLASH